MDERWNLNWKLASPDLTQLAPDLAGSVKAAGALSGTPTQPKSSLNIDIHKLVLGDHRIKHLLGTAQINAASGKHSSLDFQGSDLILGGQQWNKFLLKGAGTPEKHTIRLNLNGKPAQITRH